MEKVIKLVTQVISTIAIYELSKYLMNEIIILLTANDDIDTPCDYDMQYQQDLNAVYEYSQKQK